MRAPSLKHQRKQPVARLRNSIFETEFTELAVAGRKPVVRMEAAVRGPGGVFLYFINRHARSRLLIVGHHPSGWTEVRELDA